ncbi:Ger(x)C family spore germination protein [Brevibacillus marinus]|uniref:Ger(x)C family spore germination protein n=1 Tax=Brevibacillus marinus TaxID=2496837 RepID=UPI000F83C6D7|nr:Ger(x)C family spore germination protein [Brevibacillus marinus]
MSTLRRVLLILLCLLLTGCWDRVEINDVAFVYGTALDWQDDKIQVSLQIPLPGQMGGPGSQGGGGGQSGRKSWYTDSETSENLVDAVRRMQARASRSLEFSHQRVVLIGEALARKEIAPFMDEFARLPPHRLSSLVAVTEGPASKVMTTDVSMELLPLEMIRELLRQSMKQPRSLRDLFELMLADGIDPALPVVRTIDIPIKQLQNQKQIIQLNGMALFDENNRMVAVLNQEEAKGILWALNETRYPELIIPAPNGSGSISSIFHEMNVKYSPVVRGDDLRMNVQVRATGIVTSNQSTYDLTYRVNMLQVERKAEALIKRVIERSIQLAQKHHSDPIGFGRLIYRQHPREWKRIRERWQELYPKVRVHVSVLARIEHPGAVTEPMGIQERDVQK